MIMFRRIVIALIIAFLGSVALTWFVLDRISEREAREMLSRVLEDVKSEVEERINDRLVSAAMAVRDTLDELPDTSSETLAKLAHDLRVEDVCLVDERGIMYASAHADEIGLDFHKDEQTREFLRLLDNETEFVQDLRPSAATGELRKYAGVWRPEGGFVQVGGLLPDIQRIARASLAGLTHNRHVAGAGRIVIATEEGQILSDSIESGLEGSLLQPPSEDEYTLSCKYNGFLIHGYLPRSMMSGRRNWFVALTSILLLAALVAAGGLVGVAVAREVRRRMRERLAAEMHMAREIQTSAIPTVFPPYPEDLRMDVYAQMDTAKEVGGDFYDFYHVGKDRFAVVIADVSGKGVPAAMFMMKAKAILKGCLTTGGNLSEAMEDANRRLSENNAANMFVTSWVGVVNLSTGQLEYVNCGHNPPYIRRVDAKLEQLGKISGPPLGVFASARYRSHAEVMNRGELLFLYTDGVTEAIDANQKMFGAERLERLLATDSQPCDFCRRTKEAVDAFAAGVEQFDDITTVAFRYRGEPTILSRVFSAKIEGLAEATEFIDATLASTGCPPSIAAKIMIAVDEIGSNIAHYSGSETMEIVFESANDPSVIRLTFIDGGKQWNPLAHHDPDVTLGARQRDIGGLGILMVKKLMDGVRYEWRDERNVLTLRKCLPWKTEE